MVYGRMIGPIVLEVDEYAEEVASATRALEMAIFGGEIEEVGKPGGGVQISTDEIERLADML